MRFDLLPGLLLSSLLLLGACAKPSQTPSDAPVPAPEAAPAETAPEAAPAPAPEATSMATPDHVRAAVDAPDRAEADRALDEGRHPAELLAYYQVEPGMKVAEMMAGGGYTAELLARAVGPEGVVYGVNSPFILERFAAEPWAARLEKPVNANIVRLDTEFDAPFPEDVRGLDRVFSILVYHDFVWLETDRAAMNKAIFDALKPGGIYAIVDHSAEAGSGVRDVKTLHRIDLDVVREEVRAAGFALAGEADFLSNPEDTRDWNAPAFQDAERRGTSDRFVLTFVKP